MHPNFFWLFTPKKYLWMNYTSWMRSNYRWYILDELYFLLRFDEISWQSSIKMASKCTWFIKMDTKKTWNSNSKPSNLLLICSKVNWVDWILRGLLPPKLQRFIKSKEMRERRLKKERKGGGGGGAQRQYVKNKFRCSLNFWAEASADQKSNLCIGQPKFFLVGALWSSFRQFTYWIWTWQFDNVALVMWSWQLENADLAPWTWELGIVDFAIWQSGIEN
jgi:hypothetical protein